MGGLVIIRGEKTAMASSLKRARQTMPPIRYLSPSYRQSSGWTVEMLEASEHRLDGSKCQIKGPSGSHYGYFLGLVAGQNLPVRSTIRYEAIDRAQVGKPDVAVFFELAVVAEQENGVG